MTQGSTIRWGWCAAMAVAALFALAAFSHYRQNLAAPMLLDHLSFWAAGQLALDGQHLAAWDIARHREVMATVTAAPGTLPFPYPPPFLFFVLPFAWAPYALSFGLWLLATGGFYLWATRAMAPLPYRLSQPAVLINLLIGQNGFLTAGLFFAGVARLAERPFLSGAILGTLIVKPQLALMLPVAVVAAKLWPAIMGAALTSLGLALGALLVFGAGSYAAFLQLLPFYSQAMIDSRFSWEEFASVFALLRVLGLEHGPAMGVHLAVAAGAAALCWTAWAERWDGRVAVLPAATLLASPYLQGYDSLLMLAPFAWFLDRRPLLALTLFLVAAMPIVTQAGFATLPNVTPIAALLALAMLWREARQAPRSAERRAALAA